MFWETIAAILLICATAPIWLAIGIAWGTFKAVVTFVIYMIVWLDAGGAGLDAIIGVVFDSVSEGIVSAIHVPAWIWNWAKFEHPWWAAIIALVIFGCAGKQNA